MGHDPQARGRIEVFQNLSLENPGQKGWQEMAHDAQALVPNSPTCSDW